MTPDQKEARVARARAHQAADRLRSGFYADEDDQTHLLGCSVGCDAIDIVGWENVSEGADAHEIVAEHDGTPVWVEHLRDCVFEGLPAERRGWWHLALADAMPAIDVEAYTPLWHQISIRLLRRQLTRADQWDRVAYGDQVVAAIEQAIAYHENPSAEALKAAARSARSAAWSATARPAAAEAAWSAAALSAGESAWMAAAAARSAAWSATAAATATEATAAEYVWIAEMILGVMREGQTEKAS